METWRVFRVSSAGYIDRAMKTKISVSNTFQLLHGDHDNASLGGPRGRVHFLFPPIESNMSLVWYFPRPRRPLVQSSNRRRSDRDRRDETTNEMERHPSKCTFTGDLRTSLGNQDPLRFEPSLLWLYPAHANICIPAKLCNDYQWLYQRHSCSRCWGQPF